MNIWLILFWNIICHTIATSDNKITVLNSNFKIFLKSTEIQSGTHLISTFNLKNWIAKTLNYFDFKIKVSVFSKKKKSEFRIQNLSNFT